MDVEAIKRGLRTLARNTSLVQGVRKNHPARLAERLIDKQAARIAELEATVTRLRGEQATASQRSKGSIPAMPPADTEAFESVISGYESMADDFDFDDL